MSQPRVAPRSIARHGIVIVNIIAAVAATIVVSELRLDATLAARTPSVSALTNGPGSAQAASDRFVPARRVSGSLPATPPPTVIGWIDETLEVAIDATGHVAEVKMLRATQLPTDPLALAVADWRFRPATYGGHAVPSRVLVAAMFRPPQLYDNPTLGAPPVDLAAPSDEIPFPLVNTPPRYPPLAIGDAIVLVEASVTANGRAQRLRIVGGAPTFDRAALDAAIRWSYRPARWNNRVVQAYAYLVFGFRQPN